MPLVDGTYVPTSKEHIYDLLATELQTEFGIDGDIDQLSVLDALVDSWSETVHEGPEHSLRNVYESGFLDTAVGEDLDKVVRILGVDRIDATHATGVITFSRDTASDFEYVIQSGTTVQTQGSPSESFETTESAVIPANATSVDANIRHVDGGEEGNVGANTITVMPSPPDGVDNVTNAQQTGNPNYTDTNGDSLVVGRDQESDDDLRERAQLTVTKGGTATVDALISSLVNNDDLPGVESVSLYNNRTDTDNTGSGGLPQKSFEAVVYGGRDQPIAQALFDTMSITSHDYGGVHGQEVTQTVVTNNGQSWDVSFSRPTEVHLDMTLDVVVADTFVGKTELKDRIVEYVGGTDSQNESVVRTGVGENVYEDTLEDIIIGVDDTGVRGITSLTPTPSFSTDSNGLSVIAVGNNEVVSTNSTDGSITVNVTEE